MSPPVTHQVPKYLAHLTISMDGFDDDGDDVFAINEELSETLLLVYFSSCLDHADSWDGSWTGVVL